MQVYQHALSQAEVTALYSAGRGGGAETWTRDERGLPTSMTDADLDTTTYAYDEAGNEAQVTAPAVTTEVYNPATGIDTAVTANPVMYYGYDTFGEKTQVKDPDGNITTYGYDGDGHENSRPSRPTRHRAGAASITAPTVSTYDGDGNLIARPIHSATKTTYTYDQMGDLATEVTPGPDGGTTHDTYDTNGQQPDVHQPDRRADPGHL